MFVILSSQIHRNILGILTTSVTTTQVCTKTMALKALKTFTHMYVCTYIFLLLLPIWFVAFLLITHWIYTLSPYIFHKGPLELTLHLRGAHDWGIGVGGGEVLHSTLWCCTVIRYGMNKTCQVCIGNSVKLNYSLISTPTNFRVFALSSWMLWPGHSCGGFVFQTCGKYWSILLRHFI